MWCHTSRLLCDVVLHILIICGHTFGLCGTTSAEDRRAAIPGTVSGHPGPPWARPALRLCCCPPLPFVPSQLRFLSLSALPACLYGRVACLAVFRTCAASLGLSCTIPGGTLSRLYRCQYRTSYTQPGVSFFLYRDRPRYDYYLCSPLCTCFYRFHGNYPPLCIGYGAYWV